MPDSQIMVSVVCTTYNQRDYIEDCLDSLLNQKVDFAYEVIVHDDASDDGTAEVVRRYAKMYPDVIVPICQTENQYSKEPFSIVACSAEKIRGKYVATCEGDDYWTASDKLSVQVAYMESNPDCSLCVHAVTVVDGDTGEVVGRIAPSETECDYDVIDLLEPPAGGGMFGTNSTLMRSELFLRPPLYRRWGYVGDYPKVVYCATKGRVHYMPKEMSAYRRNAKNSFSVRMSKDSDAAVKNAEGVLSSLVAFDEATNGAYHEAVDHAIQYRKIRLAARTGDRSILADRSAMAWLATQPVWFRVTMRLACLVPSCLRDTLRVAMHLDVIRKVLHV